MILAVQIAQVPANFRIPDNAFIRKCNTHVLIRNSTQHTAYLQQIVCPIMEAVIDVT